MIAGGTYDCMEQVKKQAVMLRFELVVHFISAVEAEKRREALLCVLLYV